jgi:ribulose-bisphosphate carboxylase small chain
VRITQGTLSFLPDLSDDELAVQLRYAIAQRWALAIEHTDDPHPRNPYWEMWGPPAFDLEDEGPVVLELDRCREAFPEHYVKVVAYDPSPHRQTTAFDLVVHRPPAEPGFTLDRQEVADRRIHYTLRSYAADRPHGARYGSDAGP